MHYNTKLINQFGMDVMAGSVRKFKYVSDDGETYAIVRDESNTETLNTGDANAIKVPTNEGKYPYGAGTRYALLYQKDEPTIKRKITILTPDIFAALSPATDFSLQVVGSENKNFRISALIGERRTGLATGDTGQDDGDDDA